MKIFIDGIAGTGIYLVLALLFDRPLHWTDWGIVAIVFAYGPDFDFIPFVLLRRRFRLVSHWFIHYPLPYLIVGVLLVWWAASLRAEGSEAFYGTAFVLTSLAHFFHDSTAIPGIRWFWPLYRPAFNFWGLRFHRVDETIRQHFYDRKRAGASKRSIKDEIMMRISTRWRDR